MKHRSYWESIWLSFKSRPLGLCGLVLLAIFVFVALYAPFLASSKPLCVVYDGHLYFPLFRYLVSSSFFTKKIDIFFNLLSLFVPLFIGTLWLKFVWKRYVQLLLVGLFAASFVYFGFYKVIDPAISAYLNRQKEARLLSLTLSPEDDTMPRQHYPLPSWDFELEYLNDYAKLNLVLQERNRRMQHEAICKALHASKEIPYTLYYQQREREKKEMNTLKKQIEQGKKRYEETSKREVELRKELKSSAPSKAAKLHQELMRIDEENRDYEELVNRFNYIQDKTHWLDSQQSRIHFILMPLIRPHHWEDDVGGEQALNLQLPFLELSRTNRNDLVAALIFGSRISLFVGSAATLLALVIGIPLGLVSGFYGAGVDIVLCRFVEVWEAMPVFFMLLLIVTLLQTKSIFVVIAVISVFSWMTAFRFVRAETFRQREMLYVDATRALGFPDSRIICRHILPNSILAVLALLPFDIMSAITREAALAFLGLGEEQSCSWGVLMDEGRSAFPAESSLLWPPAIVLTILLIAIAFVGEALQGAMDPKSEE